MGLFHLMTTQPDRLKIWSCTVTGIVIFLISAVISLTAQGTSNLFNPHAAPDIIRADLAILKSSLILLLLANVSFLGVLASFHRRCSLLKAFAGAENRNTRILVFMLYTAGTLILVRNFFCTVQIFSPSAAPVWRTEALFWVFDASPLLISTLLLNVLHPARLVPMRTEERQCSS
jgi:hypothetical protein